MNNCDIIIIGSGASGSAAAWNLSSSGYKIVIFEQGNTVKKDFDNSRRWEIEKRKVYNVDPNIRNSKSDYPIDNKNSSISIANFNGVGGATVLYSGHFPRFRETDFNLFSKNKVGSDWPFNYKDLEKYYNLNDQIMNVSGRIGDP